MNRQWCTFGAMTGRSLLARCHGIQLPLVTGPQFVACVDMVLFGDL